MTDPHDPLERPAEADDYDLLDTLSHLLRRSHFHAEALFAQEVGHHDITSRQLAILVAVSQSPGLPQRIIGEAVALDANTTSDLVRRMERNGLLERRASETDQRSVALHLTARGRRKLGEVFADNRSYQARLTERLSAAETASLKALLRKLLDI